MKYLCLLSLLSFLPLFNAQAQTSAQYLKQDSIKIVSLLKSAKQQKEGTNLMIYFARQLKDVPYVGKTLEKNSTEKLVVNTRQLDCTTYVETVVALSLCAAKGQTDFQSYLRNLQKVRYRNAQVSYPERLHYFTQWIDENTKNGIVAEIDYAGCPLVAVQTLQTDYMSTHAEAYPMFKGHPQWLNTVKKYEKELSGRQVKYIEKKHLNRASDLRKYVSDGDIIAITTSKRGLDTSHIGIAVWHSDGLHMLNASQIHKKVVEEPMLLYTYMAKHPTQTGVRIVRMLCKKRLVH